MSENLSNPNQTVISGRATRGNPCAKIRGCIAMDKYDPNRDLREQNTPATSAATRQKVLPESTISNFYKEFVQFAIVLGLVVVPVYTSFDYLNDSLRDFVAQYIVQYGPTEAAVKRYSLSKKFSIIVVALTTFITFLLLFLAQQRFFFRHRRQAKKLLDQEVCRLHNDIQIKERHIESIEQKLAQQRYHLRKIQTQMYNDKVGVRHDFVSFRAKYLVSHDGSIDVTKEVILCSPELDVHFWRFYADGENAAVPLDDETEMGLDVRALGDNKTEVIALNLDNKPTRKLYSVNFLPVISKGETRSFLIRYKWPGFLAELVEDYKTQYFWHTSSFTTDRRFDFSAEWHFAETLGDVRCEIPEGHSIEGMTVRREREASGSVWTFAGENVPIGNRRLALKLWR